MIDPFKPDRLAFDDRNAVQNVSHVECHAEIFPIIVDVYDVIGVPEFRISRLEFKGVLAYVEFDMPETEIGHNGNPFQGRLQNIRSVPKFRRACRPE